MVLPLNEQHWVPTTYLRMPTTRIQKLWCNVESLTYRAYSKISFADCRMHCAIANAERRLKQQFRHMPRTVGKPLAKLTQQAAHGLHLSLCAGMSPI